MSVVPPENHGIILFDGYCKYCSYWVDFVMKYDKKDYFRFAALQSATAKNLLAVKNYSETFPDSVILIEKEKTFFKSAAALRVLRKLDFPFPFLYCFIIFPDFIRNKVYDFIAKNRYKWFGKKEFCRIPVSEEEKRKFLP